MGAILTVIAMILIFGLAGLNFELFELINTHVVTISILFLLFAFLIAFLTGREKSNKEERYMIYASVPVVLPLYVYLVIAASEISTANSMVLLLLPVMTFLCSCVFLGLGLVLFFLCEGIKTLLKHMGINMGIWSVILTYIVEIFMAHCIYTVGA